MKNLKLYIMLGIGVVLATVCALLLMYSPDKQSSVFIAVMAALIGFGYLFGVGRTLILSNALRRGRRHITEAKKLGGNNVWGYVARIEGFFRHDKLDEEFARYKHQVNQQQANCEDIVADIEDYFDLRIFEAYTKRTLVIEIANTLTGLGILGTFVGLLQGISKIEFSSIDVLMNSFTFLLSNIALAFYTSICGVILSTLFDWLYRFAWEDLCEEVFHFHREFHQSVILSTEDQKTLQKQAFYERVISALSEKDPDAVQEIADKLSKGEMNEEE